MMYPMITLYKGYKIKISRKLHGLKPYWQLYTLFLPCLLFIVLFHYVPMAGIVLAFKNFRISAGIFGSPWIGLANFEKLFSDVHFLNVVFNTLSISLLRLLFGFPMPIILAIMFNELRSARFKKAIQTVVILPHFISWVILSGIIITLFRVDGGIINELLECMGVGAIPFLSDNRYFVPVLIGTGIWKEAGWGTIIYLAALSGIDTQLYEAAMIDGANRWQRILHITFPGLQIAISITLILNLSSVLSAGFDQIFNLYSPVVYETADIIDTYVYRAGLIQGKYAVSTALGIFKSVVAILLITLSNVSIKKMGGDGIW